MTEPLELLGDLIARWENEVIEFKRAGAEYSSDKIGQYVSALANEANLHDSPAGWLIFGVDNKTRKITGTDYKPDSERINGVKHQISRDTEPNTTFREIHELDTPDGRVLMFEIPPAPRGIPISWKGHYYARAGESLAPLGLTKQDEIRAQTTTTDWSAQTIEGATLEDLDPEALTAARRAFSKTSRLGDSEVSDWTTAEFMERIKLSRDGALTTAALLLLGKPSASWRLGNNPAEITWSLQGQEVAYEHFHPPFLLATTRVYQRIRNIQIRLLPQDQLLPIEVDKYDQLSILEALHNCIAHQDYPAGERVIVSEFPDRLEFENAGSFFEGKPEDYLESIHVPRKYRNPLLVQAMASLNMIDTMGYGIRRMAQGQVSRYMPLPDYDLAESNHVRLTIYGGVVDPAYTRLLMQRTDLPLLDVLALDRVQKGLEIPKETTARLRRSKLLEGRRPHLRVAATVAAATDQKADYIRRRAQDDAHYATLVRDFLQQYGTATRTDIDDLLAPYLSRALDASQQRNKVTNLLSKMRREGQIHNTGTRTKPRWTLLQ